MRGGPSGPPDEFVAFVARRMSAAGAGTDAPAGAAPAGVDAFATVARRWWWLRRRGGAADASLDRVLARADPEPDGPELTVGGAYQPPVSVWEVATRAWQGAIQVRRRRLFTGAMVLLAGLALLTAPRGAAQAGALPTVRNPLIDLVRPGLPRLAVPGLPATIDVLPGDGIEALADHPVRRAVAVLRVAGQNAVYVLGDDGVMRTFVPPVTYQIFPTTLSPSGTRAAFVAGFVQVMDLTTDTVRSYAGPVPVGSVIWLTDDELLVGGPTGSATIDLSSGAVVSTGLTAADVLQGSPMTELVSGPARVVRPPVAGSPASSYRVFAPTGSAFVAEWLGGYIGTGQLAPGGPAVRDADASRLPLPAADGQPWYATVAVDPAIGAILRILVDPDDPVPMQVLGFVSGRTVLLQAGHQVVSWNPRTGEVRLVTKLTQTAVVALRIG